MGETNSPLVAHVGYDISPLLRVKFNSLEWKNIVTHGQLKENLYILFGIPIFYCECILWKLFHKCIVCTKLDIYVLIKSLQSLYFSK